MPVFEICEATDEESTECVGCTEVVGPGRLAWVDGKECATIRLVLPAAVGMIVPDTFGPPFIGIGLLSSPRARAPEIRPAMVDGRTLLASADARGARVDNAPFPAEPPSRDCMILL
jgi:hypothetical protein